MKVLQKHLAKICFYPKPYVRETLGKIIYFMFLKVASNISSFIFHSYSCKSFLFKTYNKQLIALNWWWLINHVFLFRYASYDYASQLPIENFSSIIKARCNTGCSPKNILFKAISEPLVTIYLFYFWCRTISITDLYHNILDSTFRNPSSITSAAWVLQWSNMDLTDFTRQNFLCIAKSSSLKHT